MTLTLTETVLLLFVVLGVVWPLCIIRKTSPTVGTAGLRDLLVRADERTSRLCEHVLVHHGALCPLQTECPL